MEYPLQNSLMRNIFSFEASSPVKHEEEKNYVPNKRKERANERASERKTRP